MARSPEEILHLLRRNGASGLEQVRLRSNRRTIWSLTSGGRTLNLHRAYAGAPEDILLAVAVICREARRRTPAYAEAARTVADWPGVRQAIRTLRAQDHGKATRRGASKFCCATPAQRRYLRDLFHRLNLERFDGQLPSDIPLRLSSRMRRRLGQMRPGPDVRGERTVGEIALNVDLMLHEMAHAADYLASGHLGHGPSWRRWARKVGCRPRACSVVTPARRRRRSEPVHHVPATESLEAPGGAGRGDAPAKS